MAIKIKSPNPDAIWNKWKSKYSKTQKLEKYYGIKGTIFKLDDITAAEFVKNVYKEAIIYFEESYDIKEEKKKPVKEEERADRIEKIDFYKFNKKPEHSDWNNKSEEVPFYNTLQKKNCPACGGKGGKTCKKCNGTKFVDCPKCDGGKDKKTKCKSCNGTGHLQIEITVYNEKNEKITKKEQIKCKDCFGTGKIPCTTCGDTGKIPCKYCNSFGLQTCSDCKGYGDFYNYEIKPVPFKEEHSSKPIILSSTKISGIEKELGKEIQETIEKVEGINIRSPNKELKQKFIEPNLGYFSKEIKKIMKKSLKSWDNASKDKKINIELPLYVFPVLVMDCETRNKNKKFQVFCVGSDKEFIVFGKI